MRRQGVAVGAGAVALCLGGLLAVGGDGGADKGFVAVGAAGAGPEGAPTKAVPPEGEVEMVPLDAPAPNSRAHQPGSRTDGSVPGSAPGAAGATGTTPGMPSGSAGATDFAAGGGSGPAPRTPAADPGRPGTADGGTPTHGGAPAGNGTSAGSGTSAGGDSSAPGGSTTRPPAPKPSPAKPSPTKPKPPPAPAALTVSAPVRAKADRRWCEKVTVSLRNSGGTAVRSGTVTFATHIIGALGVDWGTRTSSQPLPGAIAPGAVRNATYTVCVDAWRVPLGMHVETRRVTAAWE